MTAHSQGGTATRLGRRAADVLLWIGAGLGLVSLFAAVAVAIGGVVPLVFTSGSMEPDVSTGSLGMARTVDADELRVGDVVSVTNDAGTRVTHRIVAIEEAPDGTSLTLQGDANPAPDERPYVVDSADRLWFSVPVLGRVVAWMTSPWAMFLGGLVAASLLFWAFRRGSGPGPGSRSESDRARAGIEEGSTSASPARTGSHRRSGRVARGVAAVAALVCLPALSMTSNGASTMALFTDNGTVTTSGFATHHVAQPASVSCQTGALGLLSMTVSTTSSDSRYEYVARIFPSPHSGNQVGSDRVMSDASGAVRSYTYTSLNFSLGLLQLNTPYYVRVYAHIPGTDWYSPTYRVHTFRVIGLGVPLRFECVSGLTAPVVGFTQPTNGITMENGALHDQITTACDGDYGATYAAACGTATDADGSITSVKYVLQRNGSTLGTRCWNGGGLWVTNCSFRDASRNAGQNRWAVPRNLATLPYLSDGAFTLIIRATDDAGNVTEQRITYNATYF